MLFLQLRGRILFPPAIYQVASDWDPGFHGSLTGHVFSVHVTIIFVSTCHYPLRVYYVLGSTKIEVQCFIKFQDIFL